MPKLKEDAIMKWYAATDKILKNKENNRLIYEAGLAKSINAVGIHGVNTLSVFSAHELLENGQQTDFYAVRKQLRKDKDLSRALDRYIASGNMTMEGVGKDFEGGLRGLTTKLGNLRSLEHVRSMQNKMAAPQQMAPH